MPQQNANSYKGEKDSSGPVLNQEQMRASLYNITPETEDTAHSTGSALNDLSYYDLNIPWCYTTLDSVKVCARLRQICDRLSESDRHMYRAYQRLTAVDRADWPDSLAPLGCSCCSDRINGEHSV